MERLQQSLPLSPNSRLVLVLDLAVLTTVVYSYLAVCYQAAFHSSLTWLLVLFYICDALYFLGVFARFFVGYKDRGVVVRSVKKSTVRLLKTTFIVDALSLLPLELLALVAGDSSFTVAALLRLNRVLRCYRLFLFFNQREARLDVNTPLLRALRFGLIAVMSIHLQACIWYAMACPNLSSGSQVLCTPGTWANYHQFSPDLNVSAAPEQWDKYILSLYWSIATVTVTGYGDIHPVTIGEKWFSIITTIWGITMFGYILGGLASMLTNSDAMRARYKHRLLTIKDHLVDTCKDESLRSRVIGYYKYLWMRSKGNCNWSIFDELPRSFQTEVSFETYKTMLEQTSVLKKTSSGFRRMLSLLVKPMLCLPSQVIVRKGEAGHKMFFVQKGLIEILDGTTKVGTLRGGDVFGEVNLVYSKMYSATVVAVTHCDILTLSRADLTGVTKAYPADAQLLKEVICERCEAAFKDTEPSTMFIQEESPAVASDEREAFGASKGKQNTQGITSKWSASKFTVTPGSKVYYAWTILVSLLALLNTWVTCFVAGFGRFSMSTVFNGGVGGILMLSILYVIDAVCILDIVVSSRTAIFTPYGMIRSTPAMAVRYLKSYGFVLDLMAVLPLEVFALIWSNSDEQWSYFALLRVNRLLKLWKVYRMFNQIENDVNMPIGSTRAVKLLVSMLTLLHLIACIWLPLACFEQDSCLSYSWAALHGVSTNTSTFTDYLTSLYWAATTMTSTGYGDITPHSGSERTFSIVAMVTGLLMFGYTLGLIAATLTNSASIRVSFIERMVAVHQFMKDHKLGKGLLKRIDDYFELLWHQSKGEYIPGDQYLMHDLPGTLMEEVKISECHEMWDNVPFLHDLDPKFLRCLALKTSTYLFGPGDFILYHGDMGREMYCIRKGNVEVLSEDLSQVVTLLGPGDYFGEMGLLFGVPRTATLRAATHCEVNMIPKNELDNVLEVFPIIKKHFSTITKDKTHMKVACAAAAKSSYTSMQYPRQFEKPSILAGLAMAMGPLIAPITRTPITPTVAACLGDKDSKLKVACPMSFGQLPCQSFLKYQKEDEALDQALAEQEEEESGREVRESHSATGQTESALRRRKAKGSVLPVSSSSFLEKEQRLDHRKDKKVQMNFSYAPWRRCRRALDRVFSFFLMRYTFLPTSRACAVWEVVVSVAAFFSLITVSLQAAFFHFHPVIWIINYILDAVFIVDMFLKFHTGFYKNDGMLITQPVACAKHYLKTNFALDLLAGFPIELVALTVWRPISTAPRVLSLFRINRLLRTYRLPLGFSYLEEKITNTSGLITETKFAVYMFIGTHWTACLWYFIACPSIHMAAWDSHTCGEDTWAYRYANHSGIPLSNQSLAYQYVVSLYWAVSTTANVGYGDIFALTDLERIFALLAMTCGIVGYGYIIASVAANLANADSTRARFQERLMAIKSYMKDQGLGSSLRSRVVNYYEYIWKRNKGVSFASLFHGMPVSLRAEISLRLYKKIIDQVPLFENTEIGFTKLLALSIKPVLFLKNEYIVRKGDIGSEMFFINRGTVEVVSEDGNVVFASMTEGKFFGEISLMFSVPRTASIRAATNCDLFMLTKKDLDEALSYYPQIEKQIKAVADSRADKVKKRAQIAQQAKSEGKSAGDAAAAAAKGTSDMNDEGEKRKQSASTVAGQQTTDQGVQPELDALLEIEEDAPPPVSKCSQCLSSCSDAMRTKCWPSLKLLLTFTIPHDSRFNTAFSILSTFLAYISVLTLSFQSIFQVDEPVFFVLNYTFDAYFIIEMLLKFHVTYEDQQGLTVSDCKLTALRYLKQPTGFLMDAIASFPFEIIALPIPQPRIRIGVLLYLRLIHILRLDRVYHFISTEGKKLNQKTVVTRLLTFIVLISLCTQAVACVWYMLACQLQECKAGTWAVKANMYGTPFNPYIHYTNSLYWAVATMTSTGYGELTPTTVLELLFAGGVMVIGKLLFGFILGSIASTLANLETQKVQYEEKLTAIKGYMKEQHLVATLQSRVLGYFEYLWARNKGVNQTSLFDDMPHCMHADVSLSVMEELLKNVPIFQNSETAFLRHLSLTAQPLIFLPGEYIVRKGDIGYGLFLIRSGKVEVVDDSGSVLAILGEGQYIGQRTMVYSVSRTTSMRAYMHVDALLVQRSDYERVVEHHPSDEEQVRCTAEEIYQIPVKKDRRASVQ